LFDFLKKAVYMDYNNKSKKNTNKRSVSNESKSRKLEHVEPRGKTIIIDCRQQTKQERN
jgi:hypothetical protein